MFASASDAPDTLAVSNAQAPVRSFPSHRRADDIVFLKRNRQVAAYMSKLIKIVNLEDGSPSIEQARVRLAGELNIARRSGVKVLKVIHGYGSSGVGGELRLALQATLRQMADRQEIRACIFGENWRKADDQAWALLKQFPELKEDRDLAKGNRGITVVVL